MKKKYISPDCTQVRVHVESLLNTASIDNVETGGLNHNIETDGEAEDGDTSDSRRYYDQWADEELEDDLR